MTNELRMASRITAQHLRITSLEGQVEELAARAVNAELRCEILASKLAKRRLTICRLRSRIQHARASRDLWKHRCLRDA